MHDSLQRTAAILLECALQQELSVRILQTISALYTHAFIEAHITPAAPWQHKVLEGPNTHHTVRRGKFNTESTVPFNKPRVYVRRWLTCLSFQSTLGAAIYVLAGKVPRVLMILDQNPRTWPETTLVAFCVAVNVCVQCRRIRNCVE